MAMISIIVRGYDIVETRLGQRLATPGVIRLG
jgi:hypothetical protein